MLVPAGVCQVQGSNVCINLTRGYGLLHHTTILPFTRSISGRRMSTVMSNGSKDDVDCDLHGRRNWEGKIISAASHDI